MDPEHQAYDFFHGALGHELAQLSRAAGQRFSKCAAWSRMKSSKRVYALRYSTESLSQKSAEEELRFVKEIVNRLEQEQ